MTQIIMTITEDRDGVVATRHAQLYGKDYESTPKEMTEMVGLVEAMKTYFTKDAGSAYRSYAQAILHRDELANQLMAVRAVFDRMDSNGDREECMQKIREILKQVPSVRCEAGIHAPNAGKRPN